MRDRGSASIEVVGLLPLVAVVVLAVVQGGAAIYAVQGASDAARIAARASSLDQDARQAAEGALPRGLDVDGLEELADGHVRLRVRIPRIVPLGPSTVTREAELPS